jgi:transketolase
MAYAKHLVDPLFAKEMVQKPTRVGFGEGILEAGKKNKDVVGLTADLSDSTKIAEFAEAFPERFFDVGVAEQNMMGVAAGLAISGKIPFLASYATFSPGRSWDQLRVSVCYSNANVKVAGSHSGLSVGPDGATHQALEDIAITRVLPNLTVIQPCDSEQAKKATLAVAEHKGPVYIRLTRENTPVFTTETTPFKIGKADTYRDGDDLSIVACGPVLYEALAAADELRQKGIEARVINCHTIKPLDSAALVKAATETGAIVTVEEHQVTGGLGSAVAELLGRQHPTLIEMVAVRDHFGESGEPEELLAKFGLNRIGILKAAHCVLRRKGGNKSE